MGSIIQNIYGRTGKHFSSNIISNHRISWKRYYDDNNCFIKEDSIDHVMSVLNGFHPSIQFTCDTESNNRLSFLDVLIIRNGQSIETCVYRKSTNTDIYVHWNSFASIQGKRSSLKALVYRSNVICSNHHHLTLELEYLRKGFKEYNNYPHWFITQDFNGVNKIFNKQQEVIAINETATA